jgi:2'-5' RNA ligase
MPRLFAAIAPPPSVREALALSRGGLHGARWVDPSDYHITLRFIGDVDEAMADRVAARLSEVPSSPFDVDLLQYDCFGGDRPRSVHLRVRPGPELTALHEACEGACRAAGLEPESRRFTPHFTVARLRSQSGDEVARWLGDRHYAGPKSFRVESFGLYTGRPGGGAPYHRAVGYPLEGEA